MKTIGIIPARYASTRFPGKPLANIKGKPMIQWVYQKTKVALNDVWVATEDQRIYKAVSNFGGNVVITSNKHQSGTDRCAEAAEIISTKKSFDVIINIQGDEPFIDPEQIIKLKNSFKETTQIATLIKEITTQEDILNPNKPKVVINHSGDALYFSRLPIPYLKDKNIKLSYWGHIGIYAYRHDILQKISKLGPGKLEIAESLEQLRWLENGFRITTIKTKCEHFGIDTPEDLEKALQLFK